MDSLCSKNLPGSPRPLGIHRQAWEHPNSHATLPAVSAYPGTKRPDFLFVKYFEILQRAASVYRPQILPSLKPLPQGGLHLKLLMALITMNVVLQVKYVRTNCSG